MATFWESIKEKSGIFILTTIISIVTVFSDRLVGDIKAEINKADQRPAQQEKIAQDISVFVFTVENMIEFAAKNMTAKNELEFVVTPYNNAIDTLRKNEYVYYSSIHRYWDEPVMSQFLVFFSEVRSVDAALHKLNEEYKKVVSGTKVRADEAELRPLVKDASSAATKLETSAKELLTSLSK